MVEQLLTELARREITLVSDGDRLRFHPRAKMTPELVERLREHKAEVVAVIADPWPAVAGQGRENSGKAPQAGQVN